MSASQPANFNLQEFTDAGQLLFGGRLYTYFHGTTVLKVAYTDQAGTIPHTYTSDGLGGQYIALDARGELPAPLYMTSGSYDLTLKRIDGSIVWSREATGVENGLKLFSTSLANADGANLLGFLQSGFGAKRRTGQDKLREWKTPEDFGAKGNDPTHDDTPGYIALFASAAANGHSVLLPRKDYYLSSLTLTNCNETTIISQGAKLRGRYTGTFPHILRIDQSSITLNIIGTLIIDGVCNVGYDCGLFVGSGYNDLTGLVFLRCALAVIFDRDFQTSGDRGISEIKVTGGYTYGCLRIIEARGYNTIVNFNGFVASSGVLSNASTDDLPGGVRPAAWDLADSTTIRSIGATLFFTGSHLTNVRGTPLVDLQPIITAGAPTVPISYGTIFISASNIECNVFGGTTNPNGFVTPNDPKANISLQGNQGFIGGNSDWITLDAGFKGTVRIKGNSFYSNAPRGAYIGVSASPDANWDCDASSFGINIANTGHGSGLDAYNGGIVHFVDKQALHVNTCVTGTTDTGSVIPVCTNSLNVGNSQRMIAAYAAGVFKVPKGGVQDVEIDIQFVLAASCPNADIAVSLNGTIYKYGPATTSIVKTVTAYFPRLEEGDELRPFLANRTGGVVACVGGTLNRIIISCSNP
jgi:hypothetical protein